MIRPRLLLIAAALAVVPALAVVTPAPDRAFGTNAAGQDVLTLMGREPGNPAVNQVVVRVRNLAPVDVDGNGSPDFRTWSGTLLASNWVLTCAHALQGTNGSGGGVLTANLQIETDDGQVLAVDSFTNHPGWAKEQYLLGNDLALVRLAGGVAGVSNYARLNFSPLRAPVGVVIAGFGEQGDGHTGGNGNPDFLATGLNTLDATAGVSTTAGNGAPTNVFPATPASVGLMDFDQWTNRSFICVYPPNPAIANPQAVALSAFSFMGENEASDPVWACTNSTAAEPGYFDAAVCDFFPAAGDSGGPAFLWPGSPRLPDVGYCLAASPVVAGVMSFVNIGAGTNNNGVYGNVAGFTLVEPHLAWIYQAARPLAEQDSDGDGQNDEAEYFAGTDPYSVSPNPADYHTAPGYGTAMNSRDTRAYEVVLDNVVLTGQTNEPGNQVVLAFRVSVRNTGGGYHDQVMVFPDAPAPPDWPVELVTPFLELPDLAPVGSSNAFIAPAPTPLLIRCDATNVALVTNTLLAGQRLLLSSVELYQMCSPIAPVDAATDAAFVAYTESGNGTNHFATIEFATNTALLASLAPGTLLLENPSSAGYTLRRPGPTEPATMHLLSKLIHAEEAFSFYHEVGQEHHTEVLLVESVVVTNGSVLVSGWVRQLYEVLCAGTIMRTQLDAFDGPVRDPYNPPHGNSMFTDSEWTERGEAISAALGKGPRAGALADLLGFFTLHFPFSDVKLGPGITLDGEYLLRGLNIGLTVSIRQAAIEKVVWTLSTRSDLDLVLTAEGGASNGGLSLSEKERQLAYAPLPPITLSVFSFPLEIQPAFVVKAGCEVTAGTRIVVPIQHAVEVGCTLGWDASRPAGDEFFYEPFKNITPLGVSPPTLSEALSVNAAAWVEGSLELMVDHVAGPYLGVRATGTFNLSPLANPWWSLKGDLDLRAGLRARLLGLELADVGTSFSKLASFLDKVPSLPTPPANPANPLGHVEGDHVRWARLLKQGNSKPGPGSVCRVTGTAEDVFVLLQDLSGPVLSRLNATGDVVWAISRLSGWPAQQIAGTPDGGVVVAGTVGQGGVFAQKFTGTGSFVWSNSVALQNSSNLLQNPYPAKVLVRDLGGGNHEIFVVGYRDRGDHPGGTFGSGTMDTDPFVLKFDSAGALLWAKYFDSVDHEVVTDAIVRRDGGLLLCGLHKLSPNGTNVPGPGTLSSGWLLWAGADGSFEKARRSASALGMDWSGLTEAPDGTIYSCGQRYQTVLFKQPTLQVGRYNPDGDLLGMVTVGETIMYPPARMDYADMGQYNGQTLVQANPSPTDPNAVYTGLRDWLPNSGRTAWDNGVSLAWTPAGVIVAGTTALGTDRAVLTVCLNENLGVRWFTSYERELSEENCFDLVATADGVLVLGNSAQLYDITGAPAGGIGNGAALVVKLPFDGRVPLHPGAGAIHRFLQPGVHDSLYDQETVGIPSPTADYLGTYPLTLVSMEQSLTTATIPTTPTPTTNVISMPLEAGNANLPMSYETWAYYHFLAPDSQNQDADGDGLTNEAEYLFGTNPRQPDAALVTSLAIDHTNGIVGLEFNRALAATNAVLAMLSSTNLLDWQAVTNGAWSSRGASNLVERVRLELPQPHPNAAFFRLQINP